MRVCVQQVKLSVVLAYCKACGYWLCLCVVLLFLLGNCLAVASNVWLSKWSDREGDLQSNHSNASVDLYVRTHSSSLTSDINTSMF